MDIRRNAVLIATGSLKNNLWNLDATPKPELALGLVQYQRHYRLGHPRRFFLFISIFYNIVWINLILNIPQCHYLFAKRVLKVKQVQRIYHSLQSLLSPIFWVVFIQNNP